MIVDERRHGKDGRKNRKGAGNQGVGISKSKLDRRASKVLERRKKKGREWDVNGMNRSKKAFAFVVEQVNHTRKKNNSTGITTTGSLC